jgi:hypothetical protein
VPLTDATAIVNLWLNTAQISLGFDKKFDDSILSMAGGYGDLIKKVTARLLVDTFDDTVEQNTLTVARDFGIVCGMLTDEKRDGNVVSPKTFDAVRLCMRNHPACPADPKTGPASGAGPWC